MYMKHYLKGFSRIKGGVSVTPSPPSSPPPSPPPAGPLSLQDEARLNPMTTQQRNRLNQASEILLETIPIMEREIYNQQLPRAVRNEMMNYIGTNAENGLRFNIDRLGELVARFPSSRLANEFIDYIFYHYGVNARAGEMNPFIDAEDWNNGVFRDGLNEL